MTSRKAMATHKDTSVPLIPESGDSKRLTVHICTSAQAFNVQGLMDKIENKFPHYKVEYVELPYNNVDDYTFEGKDAVILCHSIHNRRFAITDVMDALYTDFLRNARAEKERKAIRMIGVIAHDFPADRLCTTDKYKMNMEAFRCRQPTTFKCADFVIMAGRLDDAQVELSKEGWEELEVALQKVAMIELGYVLPLLVIMMMLVGLSIIMDSVDIKYNVNLLEIVLGVIMISLFGTLLVIAAHEIHFIKELKRVAFRTSIVVSSMDILILTLVIVDEQNWKYVSIVIAALSLLLVGVNGLCVYRHRNKLTKLMSRKVLYCFIVVALAYVLLVLGLFV